MKIKNIILIIVLVLSVVFLVIYLNKKAVEIPFNTNDLPETSDYIGNHTENMKFIDTVLYRGIYDLGIEGVFINVFTLSDEVKINFQRENEMELEAHIVGEDPQYAIYVTDMDRRTSLRILAHELYHLQQYHTKRLINKGNGIVSWEGNDVDVLSIPYNERPWEKEAFDNQSTLEKKLIKELY